MTSLYWQRVCQKEALIEEEDAPHVAVATVSGCGAIVIWILKTCHAFITRFDGLNGSVSHPRKNII